MKSVTGRDIRTECQNYDIRNTLVWLFYIADWFIGKTPPPQAFKYHCGYLRQFIKWILKPMKWLKQTLSKVTTDSECATSEILRNLTLKCWAPAVWKLLKTGGIQITSVCFKILNLKFSFTSLLEVQISGIVSVPGEKKVKKCNLRHYSHYQYYGFGFCWFTEFFFLFLFLPVDAVRSRSWRFSGRKALK